MKFCSRKAAERQRRTSHSVTDGVVRVQKKIVNGRTRTTIHDLRAAKYYFRP
ncbi:MAG TPA: hypothetical protein PKC65_13325 [Pyrinomonadaceae bacterium]|nr:hypothetical protein [Pyrinomonadaceae bacterium]